jgi:2-oxoglutarate dehydrogenase E2 component (dihydrolipoamide succinyltransferase)
MAAEIKVPSLGESVTEATVAKWLKRPGEAVAIDEPIAELETDKITLEVYAPAAGTLAEILADEGANVPVGAVLGRIAAGAAAAISPHPPIADATAPPLSRNAGEGAERSEAGEGQASTWPSGAGSVFSKSNSTLAPHGSWKNSCQMPPPGRRRSS